jgi:hypothetical protein
MEDKGLKWAMVNMGDLLQTLNVLTLYDDCFEYRLILHLYPFDLCESCDWQKI